MEDEGKEEERPPSQSVVSSQTCWEYKTLLKQESSRTSTTTREQRRQKQQYHHGGPHEPRSPDLGSPGHIPCRNGVGLKMPPRKRLKASSSIPLHSFEALRKLREAGTTQASANKWDIFVLVLQTSGLQQITSRTGLSLNVSTLLVADPTSSFFKVTLWRRAAKVGAELIQAGDLIRVNRVCVSTFRGTVQANSSQDTCFRVVWRGDAFTTYHDAPKFTMLPHAYTSREDSGRQFLPDLTFSDEDPLAVRREDGCDLAAWAKREFPSVTSTVTSTATNVGKLMLQGSDSRKLSGSLEAVRRDVETTVRACIVQITPVERLWTWAWELEEGKRRKDFVSRATALLTDGHRELTLQLWGDIASEDILAKLRAGIIASRDTTCTSSETDTPITGKTDRPIVFEFTRLRPEFSFSCEALVLNTTANTTFRTLASNSPEAISVAVAVVDDIDRDSRDSPTLGERLMHADPDVKVAHVRSSLSENGGTVWARRFTSVAELVADHGFSGVCRVNSVAVRKVETPSSYDFAADGKLFSCSSDTERTSDFRSLVLHVYLGDSDPDGDPDSDSDPDTSIGPDSIITKSGHGAMVCVAVDGSALSDLLGGIPWPWGLLNISTVRSDGARVGVTATELMRSLIDGLVGGGEQGERFDAILACLASKDYDDNYEDKDSNDRIIPARGSCMYRLLSFGVHSLS